MKTIGALLNLGVIEEICIKCSKYTFQNGCSPHIFQTLRVFLAVLMKEHEKKQQDENGVEQLVSRVINKCYLQKGRIWLMNPNFFIQKFPEFFISSHLFNIYQERIVFKKKIQKKTSKCPGSRVLNFCPHVNIFIIWSDETQTTNCSKYK